MILPKALDCLAADDLMDGALCLLRHPLADLVPVNRRGTDLGYLNTRGEVGDIDRLFKRVTVGDTCRQIGARRIAGSGHIVDFLSVRFDKVRLAVADQHHASRAAGRQNIVAAAACPQCL